jgi:hypothetical protein
MPPEGAFGLCANDFKEIVEAIDRDAVADLLTGWSAIETVPDVVTEVAVLGIADARLLLPSYCGMLVTVGVRRLAGVG